MKNNNIFNPENQAKLIVDACKKAGLDGHIHWIDKKKEAGTWSEKIAMRFKNKESLPVKNSYMMCDSLDMCFFYNENGEATMTYSGYTNAGRPDISDGKLVQAFTKANQVLNYMQELMDEALRLYQKVHDALENKE